MDDWEGPVEDVDLEATGGVKNKFGKKGEPTMWIHSR